MKVLMVSPHADDAEIGCGGLISKLRVDGNVIWSVYFAPCTEDPLNVDHLEQHREAVKLLGIDKLIEYKYPRNILENYKQEIRDILFKINQEFQPFLVLCPSLHDFHQDHQVVADCCLTIFRNSIILGYESIASCPTFSPNVYITLSKLNARRKMQVFKCYKSQIQGRPSYFTPDAFLAHLKVRGAQVRVPYAEAYEFVWGCFL